MELTDEEVMHQVRQDLDIATLPMIADGASGIVAKCRIAELLDIELNSVNRFKSKLNFSK
jgi:dimethylamine--corrinoid protein Co-methyltransferase